MGGVRGSKYNLISLISQASLVDHWWLGPSIISDGTGRPEQMEVALQGWVDPVC